MHFHHSISKIRLPSITLSCPSRQRRLACCEGDTQFLTVTNPSLAPSLSAGYGFVSFGDNLEGAKALKEMNGRYVGNRPCKLSKSTWDVRAPRPLNPCTCTLMFSRVALMH